MPGLRDGLGGGTGNASIKNEFFDGVRLVDDAKLYFRDTGLYIQSDSDGKLKISADGSGNVIRFSLADKDGSSSVIVEDSDTFPVSKLDSAGNIKNKGKVQRV